MRGDCFGARGGGIARQATPSFSKRFKWLVDGLSDTELAYMFFRSRFREGAFRVLFGHPCVGRRSST